MPAPPPSSPPRAAITPVCNQTAKLGKENGTPQGTPIPSEMSSLSASKAGGRDSYVLVDGGGIYTHTHTCERARAYAHTHARPHAETHTRSCLSVFF